ncbi:FYVE zinc finger-domain-containing protein [Xylariales sp. AK1849]|nr:FYVE zinc finger-domain-containing protein [Xylariales sp. AK1849]
MASREGGRSTPDVVSNEQDEASGTESGSSYAGSAGSAPDTPACPYRNSTFHDQECSRFFDCPTHLLQRAPNEDDADDGGIEREEGSSPRHAPTSGQGSRSVPDLTSSVMSARTEITRNEMSADSCMNTGDTESPPSESLEARRSRGVPVPTLADSLQATMARHVVRRRRERESSASVGVSAEHTRPSSSSSSRSNRSSHSILRGDAPSFNPSLAQPHRFPGLDSPIGPPTVMPLRQPDPWVRRNEPEITLPRWQPDEESTSCPICHTQFSFLYRKHHCRKCGRVVCANCSPHRITIPYRYIVRPPGEVPLNRVSGMWSERDFSDFSRRSGGEQVRLCNPCVPDPNTAPPQIQHSSQAPQISPRAGHHRSQSSAAGTGYHNAYNRHYIQQNGTGSIYIPGGSIPGYPSGGMPSASTSARAPYGPSTRSRSATVNSNMSTQYRQAQQAGGYPHLASLNRPLPSMPGTNRSPPRDPVVQGLLNLYLHQGGRTNAPDNTPDNQPASHADNHPAQHIPEEDECPVCHRELPSRHLPNFETLREEHITACITAHSSTSTAGQALPPHATRRTGMFTYVATEKDCNPSEECSICFVEYEVGDKMARLECLCRFHHACIMEWFTKKPGHCPVHNHDSSHH